MLNRLSGDRLDQPRQLLLQKRPGFLYLQGQGGIQHVRGGQAQVDKASLRPQLLLNRAQERDDIVVRLALDLLHALGVVAGPTNLFQRLLGNDPLARPGFADLQFDSEPGVCFMSRRPDGGHLW